jgi:hypothetical protein
MGSAVTEAGRKVEADKSSKEGAGKVSVETTDASGACHSFWEVDDGTAGDAGERLSTGFAQQAWPQHLPCFTPQQWHTAGAADVVIWAETAKTLCQTVTTLTRTASSAVAALLSRADICLVILL